MVNVSEKYLYSVNRIGYLVNCQQSKMLQCILVCEFLTQNNTIMLFQPLNSSDIAQRDFSVPKNKENLKGPLFYNHTGD